jgi:putative aminopeptidase FrvX
MQALPRIAMNLARFFRPRRSGRALLIGFCLIASANTRLAVAQEEVEILEDLLLAVGVSGREEQVRETILSQLPGWARDAAVIDAMGNLVVTVGDGARHIAYIAHMDEIGYMVTNIRDDGFLQVAKHGGFYDSQYEGQLVQVHTAAGPVNGVVSIHSTHLWRGLESPREDNYDHADVLVDVGTSSREETLALGIALLDPITVPKRMSRLAETRLTARSMDDRFGCAALVTMARRIRPGQVSGRLTLAWVVQEEVGLRGSTALAKSLEPDVVVPVDSYVTSESPLEDPRVGNHALGGGPIVRALDSSHIAPIGLIRNLVSFAEEAGLRLSYGATQGGNDGSVFRNSRSQVLPLAIPIRYSHTAIETIDSTDLTGLIDLLVAMAQDTSWAE